MTPIQQTYLNKLKATADANMAFFEANMAAVHRLLNQAGPEATVDISDQGDVTIRYPDGTVMPVPQEILEVEGKLARFANLADRPQMLAFHKMRAVVAEPSHGDMQRYHYSNLDAAYPNQMRRHFTQYYPDTAGLQRYPNFGDKDIPLVFVLGSSLGWHLPRLLLEYRIRHLIIIDWDLDAFRLSTFFHDYVLLSRLAMERGTNLTFIIQPEVEKISRMVMSVLMKDLPPFLIHGAALFYASRESEDIQTIRATITETLWEMFFGLGYFDDELVSIKHSFANLRQGYPIYMKPGSVPDDAVAFIVGSGPSLDGLLPLLRQHRDKAVLFSCGTALSALENAGIRPDFHVEKERPFIVYEVLTKTVGKECLRDIHFLGLNVVHADVYDLFERKGVILKAADTMAVLLHQHGIPRNVILNTQPTVTNTAIDFALSAGFRHIYLFGVDMGYRDKERHHSQHTAYLNKMPEAEHLKRLLSKRPGGDIEVPGNFGGEVSTNKILLMARRQMGYAIKSHPATRVFNLNDGAAIDGAVPLHPEDFSGCGSVDGRVRTLRAIEAAFEHKVTDITALQQSLLDQVDAFIEEISVLLREKQTSRSAVIARLEELYRLVRQKDAALLPVGPLFRGFLYHLLSLCFNAISIITDEEEAVAKAEYDLGLIADALMQAREEVARIVGNEGREEGCVKPAP